MENGQNHPAVVLLVLGMLGVLIWQIQVAVTERGRSMLRRWLGRNSYHLLEAKFSLLGGPFWWRRSRSQLTLAFVAQSPKGTRRKGFALCGNWFLGLWREEVVVEWETE